jgi:hypothetical protein
MRHRFHSLCPYFAMFPEQFAEKWIERLTLPDEYVLDPFSGRGTTALSAVLLGRQAISSDINDVAYCLTRAKTNPPQYKTVRSRLKQLGDEYRGTGLNRCAGDLPPFFNWAFSKQTLCQLVFLRGRLCWNTSKVDAMIAALVLGSLHGESRTSDAYLSNQMPRTISTKPDYSVRFWRSRNWHPPNRDVFDLVWSRIDYRYVSPLPTARSLVFHSDMRKLPYLIDTRKLPVRCVITSPPYLDVTNFEEDQWLRLWFLGGPPYPTRTRLGGDDRHTQEGKYWAFISDMWRSLGAVLEKNAHVVLRIGSRRQSPEAIRTCLRHTSVKCGRKVRLVSSRTSEIRNRQTRAFSPGSRGCLVEVDCHFVMN